MRQWYYTKMGLQQGPVPESELLQKIRRAEIGDASLVWHEGMPDWLPVSEVAGLMASTAPAMPDDMVRGEPAQQMTPSMPEPRQDRGDVLLPQPPAYHGDYIAPQIPNYMGQSIGALVLSAVMMMVVCLPIGMPFAIVALVYATKVEGLRVQGRLVEANSASTAAKTWMIISYALSGLMVIGLVLIFFSFAIH